MRLAVTAATILLLGFFCDGGAEGKAVAKRHVRRDWLIIPDTLAFYVYTAVNNVSPEAGKVLMDIFETPLVQDTRGFLIQTTSSLTVKAEEYYQKVTDFLQDIKAKEDN
ncbi:apovitellenin-1-like [Pseudophryne corroboree]|uniref:apovitellenin-1-like n=1 Tax=Pseudophryne corroboree TaxID=495146 RepID=UPI003081EA89